MPRKNIPVRSRFTHKKRRRLNPNQEESNKTVGNEPKSVDEQISQELEMSECSSTSNEGGAIMPVSFETVYVNEDDCVKPEIESPIAPNISQFMDTSMIEGGDFKPSEEIIQSTHNLLMSLLPKYWTLLADQEGYNCLLVSRGKDPAFQRNIYVTHTGNLRITVHRQELPKVLVNELTKEWISGLYLTSESSKAFVDNVLRVVNEIRKYEACAGAHHLKYESMWDSSSALGFIDKNPYAEARYSRTFRSPRCHLLVPVQQKSCARCREVSSKFSSRFKHHLQEVASPHTSNDKLTATQKDSKLSAQQKTISYLRKQLQRHLVESDSSVTEN